MIQDLKISKILEYQEIYTLPRKCQEKLLIVKISDKNEAPRKKNNLLFELRNGNNWPAKNVR